VLTPNGRLARHLRWRAGIESRQAGAWLTPDILTLPQWLERCWEQSLVTGGEAGRKLLLNTGQFRHVSRGIVDELADGRTLGAGVERLVREARTVAGHWRIGVNDLRAAATGPDAEFYSAWAERFASMCRDRGWVDMTGLTELLLAELGTATMPIPQKIVLAGFDFPTAAEIRLFESLGKLDRLVGRISVPMTESTKGRRIVCESPAEERQMAAQWARARYEAGPDSLIGVVVTGLAGSAGAWRRSFLDVFDPLWRNRDDVLFPVTVTDGMKLSDSELVRTAQLLLRVPEGRLDYREVGRLLRSPYVGGWNIEAAERAQFDLRLRDDGLQQINLRTLRKRWHKLGDSVPHLFLDLIDALLLETEQVSKRGIPGHWVEWIESVLRAAQFCQGRTLSAREDAIYDDWRRSLERFASLGEVTGRISHRRALALLRETTQDQPLQRNGRDDGVQIMTPTEAAGLRFDALWVCGMSSAAWPGEPRPTPLIPIGLQRERKIPEAVPRLFRERALSGLQSLLCGTPETIASCPEFDGEESLVSSPHIESLQPATPGELGLDTTAVMYRELPLWGTCSIEGEDLPPALDETANIRGGSRLLNLQSVCPARAFFELRLGALEVVTPPFALDAATRGKLVHDAAEKFYDQFRDNGGPLEAGQNEIEQAAAAAIMFALDRHVPPMHPLVDTLRATEHQRLERLLRLLIERDQRRGTIDIVETEDLHRIEVGGLMLTVRFDRVDRSADGRLLVIDYKTGGKYGRTKWLGDRPLQMQLPLYAAYGNADGIALYWLHAKELSMTGMGFDDWGINLGSNRGHKSFQVLADDEWNTQLDAWRVICENLVGEYRNGDARIDIVQDSLATGEYAMLTRRWSLGPVGEASE